MNITFLLRLWPVYGGGETVTICLANEMIKRGWNVSVLYFKNNTRADLPFIDPAIKAVQIPDIRCDEFTTRFPDADKVTGYLKEYIQENDIHYLVNQWWPVEYIRGIRGEGDKIIAIDSQSLKSGNSKKAKGIPAAYSHKVTRVICGIGTVIKDD